MVLENLKNKRLYECYTVVRLILYQHCSTLTFATCDLNLQVYVYVCETDILFRGKLITESSGFIFNSPRVPNNFNK